MTNLKLYKCFIASPGDTVDERNACEEVFSDINSTLGQAYNIQLKSVRWENDVHPGVGLDGQDVINRQVMDDYNLFIGIMRARFGSPTHRTGSGTEEEYDIAYDKRQKNEIDEIMFYFCSKSPDNIDSIDTKQLNKVRAFKKKIQDQGVLHWSYTDIDNFKETLKRHLCQFINGKFGEKTGTKNTINSSSKNSIVKQKEIISNYYAVWRSIASKLYTKEEISKDVKKLLKLKKSVRFSKRTYSQYSCLQRLADSKRKLTYDESVVFVLAMRDLGRIPITISSSNFLDSAVLKDWELLQERYLSLQGYSENLIGNDWCVYESILRNSFNLDFSKAKRILMTWNPCDEFVMHRAMYSSAYVDLQKDARKSLASSIKQEKNPSEELYKIIVANYISGRFPQPYNTENYYRYGLDGQGDFLNSMVNELRGKSPKPQTLSWIGTSYNIGSGNAAFYNSLRVLMFIIDSGLYTSFYGTYFLSIENWYLVAHNLLRYLPYPCFFYTCQYTDKNVIRRIGQEFAYCKELSEENEDLLLKSLSAITNSDTPPLFLTGLLILSGRLYVAVPEEKWFELFVRNILEPLFSNFKKNCNKEECFENFRMAIGALKHKEHIEYIFEKLLICFNEDPENILSVICNNLDLSSIGGYLNPRTELILVSTINNSTSQRIFEFVSRITKEIKVNDSVINATFDKLRSIPDAELSNNPFILMNMLLFSKNDELLQKRIRPIFLQTDMWHCGLMDDGNGYSDPKYIRLNLLQNDISWSSEEFEYIKNNLEHNITKFKPIIDRTHSDSFMRSERIQYFCDIRQFIDGLEESRKKDLKSVYEIVCDYLNDSNVAYSFENELLSDQSADISNAIKLLEVEINLYGLEKNLDEFELVLDRALLMQNSAMKTNIGAIHHVILSHYDELNKLGLIKKILSILKIYKQKIDDFQDMDIDIYWVFNHIYGIAKKLEENDVKNILTDFWLNDNWVLRFVRFHK